MALHDPDSTEKEKAMALKIGRQKKIQIIDGQQVEVFGGFEDDEECEDDEEALAGEDNTNVMAVQGDDGQHYVVLEVIQVGDETKPTITTTATNEDKSQVAVAEPEEQPEDLEMNDDEEETNEVVKKVNIKHVAAPTTNKADVANCFGFDDVSF